MEPAILQQKFYQIKNKRESLVALLEQPNLGILRVDLNQALEELDELIEEFELTFPAQTE